LRSRGFARLAPATGGPYAYSRLAYGDFAGFLVAWGYWISIWTIVLVNLRGVKTVGVVAEITTCSKMVPFVAIAIIGLGCS
jgi:arginine:agmatine antiporter